MDGSRVSCSFALLTTVFSLAISNCPDYNSPSQAHHLSRSGPPEHRPALGRRWMESARHQYVCSLRQHFRTDDYLSNCDGHHGSIHIEGVTYSSSMSMRLSMRQLRSPRRGRDWGRGASQNNTAPQMCTQAVKGQFSEDFRSCCTNSNTCSPSRTPESSFSFAHKLEAARFPMKLHTKPSAMRVSRRQGVR